MKAKYENASKNNTASPPNRITRRGTTSFINPISNSKIAREPSNLTIRP